MFAGKGIMHPKILLVNPPQVTRYPQPPLGLAMVAAVREIDVIVRGEGEQTTLELVEVLEEGPSKMSRVLGIAFREGSNVRSNPLRQPVSDLATLPFPAFHLLPIGRYHLHPPFGRRSPV